MCCKCLNESRSEMKDEIQKNLQIVFSDDTKQEGIANSWENENIIQFSHHRLENWPDSN